MATRSLSRSAGDGPSLWLWLGIALVVVLLDQFAKALIVGDFRLGESRTVTSFFDVVRLENTGMAWSLLADAGGWQRWFFIALALAASAFMVYLLARNRVAEAVLVRHRDGDGRRRRQRHRPHRCAARWSTSSRCTGTGPTPSRRSTSPTARSRWARSAWSSTSCGACARGDDRDAARPAPCSRAPPPSCSRCRLRAARRPARRLRGQRPRGDDQRRAARAHRARHHHRHRAHRRHRAERRPHAAGQAQRARPRAGRPHRRRARQRRSSRRPSPTCPRAASTRPRRT